MPIAPHIYCFDTSALIHAWIRAYPPKHFGSLWEQLDGLISAGRIFAVAMLMRKYPKLVDTSKGKSGADPFVIAQAMAANPMLIVVTQEDVGSAARPKIPYVCAQQGITCMRVLDVIQAENWSF